MSKQLNTSLILRLVEAKLNLEFKMGRERPGSARYARLDRARRRAHGHAVGLVRRALAAGLDTSVVQLGIDNLYRAKGII